MSRWSWHVGLILRQMQKLGADLEEFAEFLNGLGLDRHAEIVEESIEEEIQEAEN